MGERNTERITRKLTAEEKTRHAEIREQVMKKFPLAMEAVAKVLGLKLELVEA